MTVTGENVEYAGRFLYLSDDQRVAVGDRAARPVDARRHPQRRDALFPAGPRELHAGGRRPYELKAGDFCFFPPGVDDVWEVEETYVKLFVLHSDDPLPF